MSTVRSDLSRPVKPKPPPRPGRTQDPITLLMLVGLIVIGLIGVFQHVYYAAKPEVKQALDYPIQRVEEHVLLGHKYVVATAGVVHVTGIKCNITHKPVEVSGTMSWVSVEPPGVSIEVGSGSTVRAPGCFTNAYENQIPDEVIKATREILDRDPERRFVTWRITGTETPADPLQAAETWQSEQFDLYLKAPRGHP